MKGHTVNRPTSAVYITFAGNCKKALGFYQSCFGGRLQLETFDQEIPGYTERPVVNGSLVADRIIIHGSDLVHQEGRKVGNYMAIFLPCSNPADRKQLIEKLEFDQQQHLMTHNYDQKFIEITDVFEVRWILGIN